MNMREMKDSGIEWVGNIPDTWKSIQIKNLFTILSGATPTPDTDNWDGDVLWITPADYKTKDKYVSGGKRNISQQGFNTCSTSMIPKGSIIFSKRAPIGTVAINTEVLCTNQGCLSCVSKADTCNDYYYYVMSVGTEHFELLGSGTTFKEISANSFSNCKLPCPDKCEQEKIASFLDERCSAFNCLISDIQSQIEALEEYKRSVITEAVTKGLDPDVEMRDSGVQWIGEIPTHWTLIRIGSLYGLRTQKVSDIDYPPLSVTKMGVLPQLDTVAKTNAHDDRKLIVKGDFVINSRSDRRGSCGISDYTGSVSLINTVLFPITEMNPRYYNWYFHTVGFADEFYRWGHGIVDDLWTTGWQDMKNILISVPPLDEQQRIADYLDSKCAEIDNIITEKKQQIETIEEYKKSLIFEYVTGKKEVQA